MNERAKVNERVLALAGGLQTDDVGAYSLIMPVTDGVDATEIEPSSFREAIRAISYHP